MAESIGWLIAGAGVYWTGRNITEFDEDVNKACRFARREDAERIRCWMLGPDARRLCRSEEHMWLDREEAANA